MTTIDNEKLIAEIKRQFGSQRSLSRKAGVHEAVLSKALKNQRGLSPEAAEHVGEALDLDPAALFISTQTVARYAAVKSGEASAAEALASLSRVAHKVRDMDRAGDLDPTTPELAESINLLSEAIADLSASAGEQVRKFAAPEPEETYADGLRAENRDPAEAAKSLRPRPREATTTKARSPAPCLWAASQGWTTPRRAWEHGERGD